MNDGQREDGMRTRGEERKKANIKDEEYKGNHQQTERNAKAESKERLS